MWEEGKIREGAKGGARYSAQNIIPPDAEKLPLHTASYEFYTHRENGNVTIYVMVIDYHPGILAVPLAKIEELIHYLKLA